MLNWQQLRMLLFVIMGELQLGSGDYAAKGNALELQQPQERKALNQVQYK